jgi:cyclopropane fatty-acyl-phospholipid synthase-like methyltransferase
MNASIFNGQDHSWDAKDLHTLLLANIGYEFGEQPEQQIDAIRRSRRLVGNIIAKAMELGPEDNVVDLGSGCGFIAHGTAPHVRKLHCVDISADFLARCREELSSYSNVEQHLIPFADLTCLASKSINKIYSHAVFIHFNIYDVWLYLKQCAAILQAGGLLLFDFADAEAIDPTAREWADHVEMYLRQRSEIARCLNYHSMSAIDHLLELTGFERTRHLKAGRNIAVLCRKH